jgi:hypothetical protein
MKQKRQLVAVPTGEATLDCVYPYKDKWYTAHTLPVIEADNPHHLYLLSDEEIKEGDWVIERLADGINTLTQATGMSALISNENGKFQWKIVATANPDFHLETATKMEAWQGIPKIPLSLTQEFVAKQGKMDSVMVEYCEILERPDTDIDSLKLTPSGEIIWSPVEEKIDWEQVFDDAQSMHLQEFISYYKNKHNEY